MSDRKELIRDMINAIINGNEDDAAKVFTQISYDVSREKLELNTPPAEEVEEDNTSATVENEDEQTTTENDDTTTN